MSRALPIWRGLLALAMLALLVLSLVPATTPLPSTGWDKTNHLLGFATLAFLGQRAFPGRSLAVFCGLMAYGGLIEILQSLTPDRAAEFGDLLADGIGLLIGMAVAFLVSRWSLRKSHDEDR